MTLKKMPKSLLLAAALLCSVCFTAQAQHSSLFASYDCREHAELFYSAPVEEVIVSDADVTVSLEVEETVEAFDTLNGWKHWQYVENFHFGKDRGAMPMITDLNALHPYFRDRIKTLIETCKAQGITLAVVESYRTHAKQNEYKVMGKKYTNSGAGKSKHQYGLAVDLVPVIDGVAVWDNKALWKSVGVEGEKLGLRWGGRWRKPYDPGHFEWTGGLTSSHLAIGVLPPVPRVEDLYPCMAQDVRVLRRYWKEWETAQSAVTRK
jgi:peptidoglycan L-alanyl-D-glutamate endopeptidase CwlK